jgi:hypothetical protein
MKPEPTDLFLALARDVETILAVLNNADQPAEAREAELRTCRRRLPGACKEIVVALELAGHATVAARVERECRACVEAVRQAETPPKKAGLSWRTPLLERALQHAEELVVTLKALSRFLGADTSPLRPWWTQPDDGGPYYPPRYFLKHYNISPESLRDEKRKKRIRVHQPRADAERYHYSEPDVRRLWPDRFKDAPSPKP